MDNPSVSPHLAGLGSQVYTLYTEGVARTVATNTMPSYPEVIPTLSARSLRRPLLDEEKLRIWGSSGSRIPHEVLNELEHILREGNEEEKAMAEACFGVLILQQLEDRMLNPHDGIMYQFTESLAKTVDLFNRYIR